jgi:ribosomal protein S18 acetylase RimI-like enzyme
MEFAIVEMFQLPDGLRVRPATASDQLFLAQLFESTRQDLHLIDQSAEATAELMDLQFRAQTQGYGQQFPNAMYFVIEKHHEAIGKVTLDFGSNEIRLVDIALLPKARGQGFAASVVQSLQLAASKVGTPMTLTVLSQNLPAKQLYARLGFQPADLSPPYEQWIWYPPAMRSIVMAS